MQQLDEKRQGTGLYFWEFIVKGNFIPHEEHCRMEHMIKFTVKGKQWDNVTREIPRSIPLSHRWLENLIERRGKE